jgi:hypothetical protein
MAAITAVTMAGTMGITIIIPILRIAVMTTGVHIPPEEAAPLAAAVYRAVEVQVQAAGVRLLYEAVRAEALHPL